MAHITRARVAGGTAAVYARIVNKEKAYTKCIKEDIT